MKETKNKPDGLGYMWRSVLITSAIAAALYPKKTGIGFSGTLIIDLIVMGITFIIGIVVAGAFCNFLYDNGYNERKSYRIIAIIILVIVILAFQYILPEDSIA